MEIWSLRKTVADDEAGESYVIVNLTILPWYPAVIQAVARKRSYWGKY